VGHTAKIAKMAHERRSLEGDAMTNPTPNLTAAVLATAAIFLTIGGASAKNLPECDDQKVRETLARTMDAGRIFGITTYGNSDGSTGKRWCLSAVLLQTSLVNIRKVIYSVELINESEGTFWVEIKSNEEYRCLWYRDIKANTLSEWFAQCESYNRR
jgi:hypothetical protein